jgi:hypothetical protein
VSLLVHEHSPRLGEAVHALMIKTDDPSIALACMARLMDRGYDVEIRRVSKSFLARGVDHTTELRSILARVRSAQ